VEEVAVEEVEVAVEEVEVAAAEVVAEAAGALRVSPSPTAAMPGRAQRRWSPPR
jgi:uncharacterized protein with von Willebrand factor type A (vWA) domain